MHHEDQTIRKADNEAKVGVSENGWNEVRETSLFDHILRERLQRQDLCALGFAPREARLLLAALLYNSRRRADAAARADAQDDTRADARADARAVLLCYVMLNHVFDKIDNNNLPKPPFVTKPIESYTTDRNEITDADCITAAAIMRDYVAIPEDIEEISDRELLHPLVALQHCLSQLSDLNALCGAPLPRAALRAAYAGPLVYKLRRAMRHADPRRFLDTLLSPAPTVLAFLTGLINVYELLSA